MSRAWKGRKVGELRVRHRSSVARATQDSSLRHRTGPGRGRWAGRGPASLRLVGRLAVPGRFEEPEASVTLSAHGL